MMRKTKSKGIIHCVAALAVCLGAVGTISGQEAEDEMVVPLGTIVLGAPEGVEQKRAAVDFPHAPRVHAHTASLVWYNDLSCQLMPLALGDGFVRQNDFVEVGLALSPVDPLAIGSLPTYR